jgi:hypothetical protein
MRKCGLFLVAVVLTLAVVLRFGRSQPASSLPSSSQGGPSPLAKVDDDAGTKLEALKKRLPDMLAVWNKEHAPLGVFHYAEPTTNDYVTELRLVRRTSPTTAKITFLLVDKGNRPGAGPDECSVSIYLSYYDGLWTTTGVEGAWGYVSGNEAEKLNGKVRRHLMLAIDEIGDK